MKIKIKCLGKNAKGSKSDRIFTEFVLRELAICIYTGDNLLGDIDINLQSSLKDFKTMRGEMTNNELCELQFLCEKGYQKGLKSKTQIRKFLKESLIGVNDCDTIVLNDMRLLEA